jgi:hypothetical protein
VCASLVGGTHRVLAREKKVHRSTCPLIIVFRSGYTTRPPMPSLSLGVVGRLSGFTSAVTKFLDTEDMHVLCQVCRQDLHVTEQIRMTSARLLTAGGPALLQRILRSETEIEGPVSYAWAYLHGLRLVRAFFHKWPHPQTMLRIGTNDGLSYTGLDLHLSFHRIEMCVETHISPNCHLKPIVHALGILGYTWDLLPACSRLLLDYLLQGGPLFNHVLFCDDDDAGRLFCDDELLEHLVTLWFALGVAPELIVETDEDPPSPPPGSSLAIHRAHISYRYIYI